MEQYEAGERFVTAVIDDRGKDFLNRVWEGPDRLPTLDEIRTPSAWIARMEAAAAAPLGEGLS
jgi:uncharacterized protein (DUF2342 family)